MTDENKPDNTPVAPQTQEVKDTAGSNPPAEETQEQIHWKRFREAREKDRREKEAAQREAAKKAEEAAALKAAMEALLAKPQAPFVEESEETEEQRIERKVQEALAKRKKEEDEQRAAEEQKNLPTKLKSSYADFDQVCSEENLDYLEYHYPEVVAPYSHLPNTFDKWSNIYKLVKRFIPNPVQGKEEKKRQQNLSKPQSISMPSAQKTGDSAPLYLDEAKRKANWERMQREMKSIY